MLPEGNTMVMVPNVEFGRRIAKLIPNSVFFYGKDSKKIRQELYASFDKRSDLIAITTFQLASTGLNIKRIFNLFLVDGGKSFVQIIQSIGRGLRKAKDKDKIRVYDVHSDFKYCKRHAVSRKKHYTKKKYPYKQQKVDYLGLGA
jgi:superfamily II DNA or RNA helicase